MAITKLVLAQQLSLTTMGGNRSNGSLRQPDSLTLESAMAVSPIFLPANAGLLAAISGFGHGHMTASAAAVVSAGALMLIASIVAAIRKSLVKSEDHKHLLDNAPIGIYRTTPDGRILLANLRLAEMLGYQSVDDLLLRDLESDGFQPTCSREQFKEVIEREGEIKGFEYVWKRRDGSSIHVRENARVVRDRMGQTLYYEGTVEDVSDRKIMEEAIAQSERDYRSLFDGASDAILIVAEPSEEILEANLKALELYGLKKTEIVGRSLKSLSRNSHGPAASSQLSGAAGFDTVHFDKAGRELFLQAASSRIRYKGNQALLLILRDVSNYRKAERALTESQSLLRTLIDALPQRVFCKDLEGRYTVVNSALTASLGKGAGEIVGKTDFDLYPRQVAEANTAQDSRVLTDSRPINSTEQISLKDGSIAYVDIIRTPQVSPSGAVIGLVGLFWDVTERKLAEQSLARDKDFLGALMDSIPDTIYFKDLETRFTRINKAQAKLLGLSDPSEAVGKTDFDFFADSAKASYADDQTVLQSGVAILDRIEKVTNQKGSTAWVSASKVPIRTSDGKISGLVGMSRDITERKLADEAIAHGLEEFRAQVAKISNGNLTVRGRDGDDVVGEIMGSINKMLDSFSTMIVRVKQMALAVSSSATEILAASEQIAAGSGRQADEITNTSSTVEEMAASMSQVAKNADSSAEAAKQALTMAETGERSVHDTFEAMARIRQAVDATSERMKSLAKRSSEISEIMDLINDIAAQTNLLSLNAAIEAAHAGDAGLGFSVVAEEIRKLAERSSRATRDVSAIIKAIQEESAAAQSAMDLGTREVASGAAMSEQARQSLQNIHSVVKHSSELIDEISASAEEQARVTRNLAQAMQVISNITLETSAGAHETASTLQGMVNLSEQLNEAISRFTVESE